MILPHLSTGGMPAYALKKIELLISNNEIFVVEYENITGGVLVIQRNQIEALTPIKTLGEDKNELIFIINSIEPDVIHFEEMPEFFMDINLAKEIYSKKDRKYSIVETTHDSSFDVDSKIFLPDKFFFVSEYSIEQFKSLNIPMELKEYPIEYKQRLDRTEGLNKLNLDANYKHILNVGLFTSRKNQAEIFDYARKMINEKVMFHFVGNQADNFKWYWEPLLNNKPDNCIIWGERKDVESFYSCMDLFLFTSKGTIQDKETNPLVLKEARSWNIPILMYNLPVYLDKYIDKPNIYHLYFDDTNKNIELLKQLLNIKSSIIENNETIKDKLWKGSLKFKIQQKEYEWKSIIDEILKLENRKNCLEIGCFDSGTSYTFCELFDNVYTIDLTRHDLWAEQEKIHPNWHNMVANSHDENTINNIKDLNIKFDVIFIDGDHSADGVEKDFLNYKQFLADDGIIFFHDIIDSNFHHRLNCTVDIFWNKYKENYKYKEIIVKDSSNLNTEGYSEFLLNNPWYSEWGGIGILYDVEKKCNYSYCFVVSAHPNTESIEKTTINCVTKLKNTILATHYPASQNLQNNVDNYIYDKNNILVKHTFYNISWYNNERYYASILLKQNDNDIYHGVGVHNNYYNGVSYAKSMGYKYAICTNFDMIFSENDLNKIENIVNDIDNKNKKAFFMQTSEQEGPTIKTVFCIVDVDFYLETFDYIKTEEQYDDEIKKCGSESNGLENYYYNKLKNNLDKCELYYSNEGELFKESNINSFSMVEYFTVLPVSNENKGCIWFSSSNKIDNRILDYDLHGVLEDGTLETKLMQRVKINNSMQHYKLFTFDSKYKSYQINYTLYNYDKVLKTKRIEFKTKDDLLDNGIFEDKTLKQNKKIAIFSHNYLVNNWKEILEIQLNKIINSGLYKNADKIRFYVIDVDDNIDEFTKTIRHYDIDNKISIIVHSENRYEFDTLNQFFKFSKSYDNYNILYLHSKGVISRYQEHNNIESIDAWRDNMYDNLINEWEIAQEKLKEYDTFGIYFARAYLTDINHPIHNRDIYAGNMFWSTSNYIKTLPSPLDYDLTNRNYAERWITENNPKAYSHIEWDYTKNLHLDLKNKDKK